MVLVKIKWNNTRENFAQGLITIGNSYIERKDCSCYYKLILVLGYLPILKCKPIKCKLLPFYIIPEERPAESSSKLFRNLKLPGNEPFEIWGFICLESEERGFHSLGGRGCLWIKHQTQLPRGLAERGLFPPFAWSLIFMRSSGAWCYQATNCLYSGFLVPEAWLLTDRHSQGCSHYKRCIKGLSRRHPKECSSVVCPEVSWMLLWDNERVGIMCLLLIIPGFYIFPGMSDFYIRTAWGCNICHRT